VERYRKAMRGQADEVTLQSVLRALHEQVWTPVEKMLPAGTQTVVVSPDGQLNFVSFATLLRPDATFLGAKYSIRCVASGRDLLRQREAPATPLIAVFGNPDFQHAADAPAQRAESSRSGVLLPSELRELGNVSLLPLPGTAKECAVIKVQAGKSGKLSVVFLGPDATEAQLGEIDSPSILHLATHGFFLPESGAHNLLMTLWPISDETTVEIMVDFYKRAFETGNAPQALAETQRDWLVKLRKEKGLLHAVNRAGAFIMSSQGPSGR
jgi:CHAT domain-containing protein